MRDDIAEPWLRLLGSATTLLTLLANPLNVTMLTSQLLTAPSIWARPDGLRTTLRILGIFINGARQLAQQDDSTLLQGSPHLERSMLKEDWATSVIKGADERSPRWRHLCVLAGLLIGFEGKSHGSISRSLRIALERAIVTAVNASIHESEAKDESTSNSIALMLSHVFDLLSDGEKSNLNHQAILPALYHATFFSKDGLHSGYFLSTMDADIVQVTRTKFDWPRNSSTYVQCERMVTGPMVSCLGPSSRLMALSVDHLPDHDVLATMMKDLAAFTRSLVVQWRQNKLSEIDPTEEGEFLTEESLKSSIALLWRTLRSTMFALVIILRSLLGRVLGDSKLSQDEAPYMAIQTLHILRDLYFISSRAANSTFLQYNFVNLTAIDILSQYPMQAEAFLKSIQFSSKGIPQHPLDRCHDLFFLNIAENFAIILSSDVNEALVVKAAEPYLDPNGDPRLVEMFEAAHSVMLAVLSAPQSTELLAKYVHPYVEVLFKVFPQALSPRQFRMAIKTLVRITSPPSPVAVTKPLLASTILELLRSRYEIADVTPLQHRSDQSSAIILQPALSEQSACQLATIDSLSLLPLCQLEEWLPIVAETMHRVQDPIQLQICQKRFWEVLRNGEMDADRASLCVSWWGTRQGRDAVLELSHQGEEGPMMSGALPVNSRL